MIASLTLLLSAAHSMQDDPVRAAQQRAIEFLLEEQLPDGSWVLPGNERFSHAGAAFLGFALLRSGLPREHLAIWRVDQLLRRTPPRSTYGASVRVHFLDALQPPDFIPRLERAATCLGLPRTDYYGYGYANTLPHGDLSNHQFALLALEILTRYDRGPSQQEWLELSDFLLKLQLPNGSWGYFPGSSSTPTMQLAGLACLAACQRALMHHQAKPRDLQEIQQALDRGFAAAGRHWYLDMSRARAPLKRWVHYAGATLERAASLTDRATVGAHDWYEEVCQMLIQSQHRRGSWSSGSGEPVLNTGLALATLARASAATGASTTTPWQPRWATTHGPVRIIASGTTPCTAFIRLALDQGSEYQLESCEWTLNGQPLGSGSGHRGTIRFPLSRNGTHNLAAVVVLRIPGTDDTWSESSKIAIEIQGLVDDYARHSSGFNQDTIDLDPSSAEATEASPSIGGPAATAWLFDASFATSWRWSGSPPFELELEFDERPRSRAIRIVPHLADKNSSPLESQLPELRVNGTRLRVTPVIDAAGVYYPFSRPRRVRTLQLEWDLPDSEAIHPPWKGVREIQLISP